MKRYTKILLSAGLISALLCSGAMASTHANDFQVAGDKDGYTYDGDVLTITQPGNYTISMPKGVNITTDQIVVDLDDDAKGDKVNLTLDGVQIATSNIYNWARSDYSTALFNADSDLTITLVGDNSLVSTFDDDRYVRTAGIWGAEMEEGTGKPMSITGAGTLIATGGNNYDQHDSYGIGNKGTLDITATGKIIATANEGDSGCGIYSAKELTITGANIRAHSVNSIDSNYGIRGQKNLTIENSTIDAKAGDYTWNSIGLYSGEGAVTIRKSKVTAVAGASTGVEFDESSCCGILSAFPVHIENSTVTATAKGGASNEAVTAYSAGILSGSALLIWDEDGQDNSKPESFDTNSTIKNSTIITAKGGVAGISGGILCLDQLEIENSTITKAQADEAVMLSTGIHGVGGLSVTENSKIGTAQGGKAISNPEAVGRIMTYSAGVMGGNPLKSLGVDIPGASGEVTIADSTIGTAQGGEAYSSVGVCALDTLEVTNSTIGSAQGGEAEFSVGMLGGDIATLLTGKDISGVITLKNSKIIAKGPENAEQSMGICGIVSLDIVGEDTVITATGEVIAIGAIVIKGVANTQTVDEALTIWTDKDLTKTIKAEQITDLEKKYKYIHIATPSQDDDRPTTPPVDLTISTSGAGEIFPNGGDDGIISVSDGSKRTFTVTGDVDSVIYNGKEIDVVDGKFTITIKGDSDLEIIFADAEPEMQSPFSDLDEDDDAFEAVMALYENGIINGMTTNTFGGETPINRAMITTMLHRVEGVPVSGISDFADVFAGMWYTNGINWAVTEGIVDGYPDGAFKPDQVITNQEMCKILRDYAIRCGVSVDETLTADGVADWASNAVAWAQSIDMFEGNATDVVTRAQACEMIFAVLELIAE